jgi:hypothetical protein
LLADARERAAVIGKTRKKGVLPPAARIAACRLRMTRAKGVFSSRHF